MPKLKKHLPRNRNVLNVSIKEFIDEYSYRIDLDADYQRENVWSVKQQNELLDSIMRDIDIPKMYLAEIGENNQFDFECIDGKQRMTTLLKYYKPDEVDQNLCIIIAGEKLSYKKLKKTHPTIADKIDEFQLTFTIYKSVDDDLVREIFRRLQLGIRLNSGELLKSRTGAIRDFIFKEIGNNGDFFRNSGLSVKRFSIPFTLAQICLNSFALQNTGDFVRARLVDIEDFFEIHQNISKSDSNLQRIRKVLKEMDTAFGKNAANISSRAIAVSAYLYVEDMIVNNFKTSQISHFAIFYLKLLEEIKLTTQQLTNYNQPKNTMILDEFQKYVLQASVEPFSIRKRHEFLKKAFLFYQNSNPKSQIIGSKP